MAAPKILSRPTPLREITPDGAKWDGRKASSTELAKGVLDLAHLTHRDQRRFARQADCSELVRWGRAADGRWLVTHAERCKSRLCSTCSRLKSTADFCRHLNAIGNHANDPARRFLFLTLTVPNTPLCFLKHTIGEMGKAWRRVYRSKKFLDAFDGKLLKVEITRADDGSVHPHFHVLLATSENYFRRDRDPTFLPTTEWVELWTRSMKSDRPLIADVRAVPRGEEIDMLRELLKYLTKPNDLTTDNRWTLNLDRQIRGLRVVRPSGVIRDWLRELVDPPETPTHIEVPFGFQHELAQYLSTAPPREAKNLAPKHEKWTKSTD